MAGQATGKAGIAGVFIAALRQLGDHDLTFTQLVAMLYLMEHGEASVSEVARALGRSRAATGRLADGLVKARLIAREDVPEDRRVKRLRLSKAGREFLDRLHRRRVVVVARKTTGGNQRQRERAVVQEVLDILRRERL